MGIPNSVEVNYGDTKIIVKGKFGTLEIEIPETILIQQTNDILTVSLKSKIRSLRSLHGLYRTLINNMVIGVSEQFELTLILKGVGYRAIIQGKEIVLSLGYSHPVIIEIPELISVEIIQNTTINLKSCDKEVLGYLRQVFVLGDGRNLIKVKVFYIKMNKFYEKLEKQVNKFLIHVSLKILVDFK